MLCKRKWLNELKKTSNKEVTINEDSASINESALDLVECTENFDEKQHLFDTMFQKLGDKCQELLKLSFAVKSMEEVAEKLNVTYGYVRKKKSLCVGQLTQWIQEAKNFKSLKNKKDFFNSVESMFKDSNTTSSITELIVSILLVLL